MGLWTQLALSYSTSGIPALGAKTATSCLFSQFIDIALKYTYQDQQAVPSDHFPPGAEIAETCKAHENLSHKNNEQKTLYAKRE